MSSNLILRVEALLEDSQWSVSEVWAWLEKEVGKAEASRIWMAVFSAHDASET